MWNLVVYDTVVHTRWRMLYQLHEGFAFDMIVEPEICSYARCRADRRSRLVERKGEAVSAAWSLSVELRSNADEVRPNIVETARILYIPRQCFIIRFETHDAWRVMSSCNSILLRVCPVIFCLLSSEHKPSLRTCGLEIDLLALEGLLTTRVSKR
jgi:hypothetical protein